MEVPYEEEVMGMDLETRRTKKVIISPASSDSSSITSDSSSDNNNTSFEYFATMNTHSNNNGCESTVIFTNDNVVDEVIEEVSVERKAVADVASFEEPIVAHNGTNGVSVHQDGSSVAHSVRDSDEGIKEMDAGSNGSSFSKSPNTGFGLKDVESLFNGHSENVVKSTSKDSAPEEDEFDVETVIRKQETHDLICPNCRSCITKRVILKRRKRKYEEVLKSEEASGSGDSGQGQDGSASSGNIAEEGHLPSQTVEPSGSRFDAISCFSCFRVFIPTSEGFLCWRFQPKPEVARQPDGAPADQGQPEDSQPNETGNFFPLWIVTCCQPADNKKPDETAPTGESKFQPTPENEASSHQNEPPLPTSHDSAFFPTIPAGPSQKGEFQQCGGTSQNTLLNPIKPYGDISSTETPPSTPAVEETGYSLWFVTCCQPSTDKENVQPSAKTDGPAAVGKTPSRPCGGSEPPSAPVYGSESLAAPSDDVSAAVGKTPSRPSGDSEPTSAPVYGSESLAAQSDDIADNLIPPSKPAPAPMYDPDSGISKPSMPDTPTKPNDDLTLPPAAATPGSAVLPKLPQSQPPVMPSGTPEAQPLVDVEPGLPREIPRAGVSGVDIIKAIVYGGLLESITSLSVITSAAGGDATTLNIVALGLANVFGGLVVLVHNLRLLNHEHTTTEHYEAQLGRPGHYMLHSVVAVLSYLVFGLMSPIIYGFSFRKSDNKDYKLATLAAAVLLSITVLSAAKEYVRTSPKGYIKTVFYYISLGFMVSGLGYVAGDLINELLKKLGIFDLHAPVSLPLLQAGQVTGTWSSY